MGNDSNQNNAINGWTEYGKLVLKELERLNEGQTDLKKDIDKKFTGLNKQMTSLITEFNGTENDVSELKQWKENVVEIWSVSQMKQSKNEVYRQKNQWQKIAGILIAIQILWGILVVFGDKLF